MILQTAPPANSNPLWVILLILAVGGAIADRRYRREGGRKSTRRDKVLFTVTVALVGALFVTAGVTQSVLGAQPYDIGYAMGYAMVPYAILLFAAWELGRWRVRRKNPLPKS